MSHLTTYKNNSLLNTKREMLEASLKELGIDLDYKNNTIKNTWINEKVDAAMIYEGKRIAVGLNFVTNEAGDEEVVVAGDFWGTGLNQAELTNKIAQTYQKNNVIEKCRSQRWFVEDSAVTTKENGDIVIQAYRYA